MTHSDKVSQRSIQFSSDLLTALRQMDDLMVKSLLVFDDKDFVNILSIGDIQRAIIRNESLETPVGDVLRKDTTLATTADEPDEIRSLMLERRIECMPVVNEEGQLQSVYFWDDLFDDKHEFRNTFDLPVVLMAGGKGSRLRPITNILPKPLIPLGEKTMLEHIMDRFSRLGSNRFYISVNYRADMIQYYFKQLGHPAYEIKYFQEDKPLGTAGSLYLLRDQINTTFFISNCDILIDADYSEILDYHRQNENELTIVSVLKHYKIPYGTLKTGEGGKLIELKEKPELTFKINSGMYVLEPHLLEEIPENTFYHITELIASIMDRQGRIGVFPVSSGSWRDIGQWEEYLALKDEY